jgi:hypothetical protein
MSLNATNSNTSTLTTSGAGTITISNPITLTNIANSSSSTVINNLTTSTLNVGNSGGFKTSVNVNASGSNYNLVLPTTSSYVPRVLANNGSGTISWSPSIGPTQLVVWADKTSSVTQGTSIYGATPAAGTVMNIYNALIGSSYLGPSGANGTTIPYTNFTVPATGTYCIFINGLNDSTVGPGVYNAARVTVTRSSTVVYDQIYSYVSGDADTAICPYTYVWNGFQTGDVCTFFVTDSQNHATYPSSITDTSIIKHYGWLQITKLSLY